MFPRNTCLIFGAVPYFQTKPYLSISLIISAKNHRLSLSKACIPRGPKWPLKLDDQHMEKGNLNHYPCLPLKEISGILDSSKIVNTTLIHLPNPGKNPVSNLLDVCIAMQQLMNIECHIYIYNIMQDISKQFGDTWGYSLQTWEKYTRCELFLTDGATHHRSSNMAWENHGKSSDQMFFFPANHGNEFSMESISNEVFHGIYI